MNDFTPDKNVKDKVEIVGQKEIKKQLKHVAVINPHKGHTVYEVNLKTHEIVPAEFEDKPADYEKEVNLKKSRGLGIAEFKDGRKKLVIDTPDVVRRKLIRNPDCLYISALNKRNVYKKLQKLGVIKIVRKK